MQAQDAQRVVVTKDGMTTLKATALFTERHFLISKTALTVVLVLFFHCGRNVLLAQSSSVDLAGQLVVSETDTLCIGKVFSWTDTISDLQLNMTLAALSSGGTATGTLTWIEVSGSIDASCQEETSTTNISEPVTLTVSGDGIGMLSDANNDFAIFQLKVTQDGITATAPYQDGDYSVNFTLTLSVIGSSGATLAISPIQFLPAVVGQAYGPVQLQATGGTACTGTGSPYSWSWGGNMLPAGMQLTPGGVLQGTPQRAASYQLPVTVQDCSQPTAQMATATLEFTVNPSGSCIPGSGPLTITSPGPPIVNSQQVFGLITDTTDQITATYTAQGGDCNYAWHTSRNSFFGLGYSNCTTGKSCTLSGVPIGATEPNLNQFFDTLSVKDSSGDSATLYISGGIQIPSIPAKLVATGPLNDPAILKLPYAFTDFNAAISGGRGIYACAPAPDQRTQAGLTLTSSGVSKNCIISGIPTATGQYAFTAEITDATGQGPVSVTVIVTVAPCEVPGLPGQPSNGCGPPPIVPDQEGIRYGNKRSNWFSPSQSIRADAAGTANASINVGGVVDAAAYQPVLTPGGIIAIFGSNMADGVYQGSSTPLQKSLGNVEVTVNGENAALFYVSPTQINFQAPVSPLAYYALTTACFQNPFNPATFEPSNCPAPGPATVLVIESGVPIGAVSVPVSVGTPAILALPNAAAVATHANGQLITQTVPTTPMPTCSCRRACGTGWMTITSSISSVT